VKISHQQSAKVFIWKSYAETFLFLYSKNDSALSQCVFRMVAIHTQILGANLVDDLLCICYRKTSNNNECYCFY